MGTIPASENIFPLVELAEVAAPSTPAAGQVRLYAKSDGLLYAKDDAGAETVLGGGDVSSHLADTADAHDASAVSIADAGSLITATEVEAALQEIVTRYRTFLIPFLIDGGGAEIADNTKARVALPDDCTLVAARSYGDQSGSWVIDVWRETHAGYTPPADADSITASAPITASGAVKTEDTSLTGWDTTLQKGDILVFNVESCTTTQQIFGYLEARR